MQNKYNYFFIFISALFSFILSGNKALALDTDSTVNNSKPIFEMKKSPTGAVLRSLALPGWGQYYVESYWKAPLFLAAAGTCVYFIIDNNSKFNSKDDEITAVKAANPNDSRIDYLTLQREVYRDNRDQAAFFLAGVYIISAVDAYVGAHLFDFDVSDKLSLNIIPNRNSLVSLSITYFWK